MKASEIRPNELRIGNYVYYNGSHNELGIVSEVLKNGLHEVSPYKIGINHRIDIYYKVDALKPIKLTEEILLKCGFVSGGAKKWLFLTLCKEDKKYIYLNPLGSGLAIEENSIENSLNIEIKYLHQLQNLYFALTNEELTINL